MAYLGRLHARTPGESKASAFAVGLALLMRHQIGAVNQFSLLSLGRGHLFLVGGPCWHGCRE